MDTPRPSPGQDLHDLAEAGAADAVAASGKVRAERIHADTAPRVPGPDRGLDPETPEPARRGPGRPRAERPGLVIPTKADPELVAKLRRGWPRLSRERAELAACRMKATIGGELHDCPEGLAVLPEVTVGSKGDRAWYAVPGRHAVNLHAAVALMPELWWDARGGRGVWVSPDEVPATVAGWLSWGSAERADLAVRVAVALGERHGLQVGLDSAARFAEDAARTDPGRHLDPVARWLEACADEHLDLADPAAAAAELRGLGRLMGAPDDPGAAAILTRFMLAAVARTRHPGCAADQTLILSGDSSYSKTKALGLLCGGSLDRGQGFAVVSPLPDLTDKRGAELAASPRAMVWIVDEGAGLTGGGHARRRAVSDFLTRTEDTYRGAYGRHAETRPRRCIMAVSVNPESGARLIDHRRETGARRFALIEVTRRIDLAEVERRAPRLWAAALSLVRLWEREGGFPPWALRPEQEAELVRRLEESDRRRGALDGTWTDQIRAVLRADLAEAGGPRARKLTGWIDTLAPGLPPAQRETVRLQIMADLRELGLAARDHRGPEGHGRYWLPPRDPAAWTPDLLALVAPEPPPPPPSTSPPPLPTAAPRAAAPPPTPRPASTAAAPSPPAAAPAAPEPRGPDRPPSGPAGGARGGGR